MVAAIQVEMLLQLFSMQYNNKDQPVMEMVRP